MSQFDLGPWLDDHPGLREFLEQSVLPACDPYGLSYYAHLNVSHELYGWEGVSTQLLYVADNLKVRNQMMIRRLEKWSKKVEPHA